MRRLNVIFILGLLNIFFFSTCFAAQEVGSKLVKTFDTWRVFVRIENNKRHCSIIANPILTKGFPGFRDIPYVGFTSTKEGQFSFSIYTGFAINKTQPIQVFVGEEVFFLKLYREFFAYTYDANDDVKLINLSLLSKSPLRVRAESKEHEVANDYYDLKGLQKAFKFLKEHYNCS